MDGGADVLGMQRAIRSALDDGAGRRIPVALNPSPQRFRQPDPVERVRACIDDVDIDPGRLALQITESMVMESLPGVRGALEEPQAMGVTLSIDDFGTGYSSLAYLCRLPARQLTIDRSFVIDMDHLTEARHVAEAVIRLAHPPRVDVVAEGVERSEKVIALRALGGDPIPGYHFSRPVPAGEIEVPAAGPAAGRAVEPGTQPRRGFAGRRGRHAAAAQTGRRLSVSAGGPTRRWPVRRRR